MNVMTLQCLEFLTKGGVCTNATKYNGEVAMKQCKKTDGQSTGVPPGSKAIQSKLCGESVRYYYLALRRQPAYQAQSIRRNNAWYWENEGDKLHRRNSTYKG